MEPGGGGEAAPEEAVLSGMRAKELKEVLRQRGIDFVGETGDHQEAMECLKCVLVVLFGLGPRCCCTEPVCIGLLLRNARDPIPHRCTAALPF